MYLPFSGLWALMALSLKWVFPSIPEPQSWVGLLYRKLEFPTQNSDKRYLHAPLAGSLTIIQGDQICFWIALPIWCLPPWVLPLNSDSLCLESPKSRRQQWHWGIQGDPWGSSRLQLFWFTTQTRPESSVTNIMINFRMFSLPFPPKNLYSLAVTSLPTPFLITYPQT